MYTQVSEIIQTSMTREASLMMRVCTSIATIIIHIDLTMKVSGLAGIQDVGDTRLSKLILTLASMKGDQMSIWLLKLMCMLLDPQEETSTLRSRTQVGSTHLQELTTSRIPLLKLEADIITHTLSTTTISTPMINREAHILNKITSMHPVLREEVDLDMAEI